MKPVFYLVGGAVRDKILGIQSKDQDFAVEADSFEDMKRAILDMNGKIFLEKPEFLTIRAIVPNLGAADYTLTRADGSYRDGRHPDSVSIGTIFDDLARRDFTINAIAINAMTKELIDPHGGLIDINARVIRCVGDTVTRMKEDGLRGYRAMRFSVTKGFQIAHSLDVFLLHAPASLIENVSMERIRDELFKMFQANTFAAIHMINAYRFPWFQKPFGNGDLWLKPTAEKF